MPKNLNFKYLVLSGGGAAGIAFAGAIDQLIKTPDFSLDTIKEIAGTSVGSITGLMVSLGYSAPEFIQDLGHLDLKKLQDSGSLPANVANLYSRYGVYKGAALYEYILFLIRQKTNRNDPENVTFADLQKMGFKKIHVVTTKFYTLNGIPTGKRKIFSADTTPDTAVASAILASCSAPLYFQRVRMKKVAKGHYILSDEGDLYSDGGAISNFPIDIFDKNKYLDESERQGHMEEPAYNPYTLGLAVLATEKIVDPWHLPKKGPILDNSPLLFGKALVKTLQIKVELDGLEKDKYHERTVQIDRLGIKLNDFQMSEADKQRLVESGRLAVQHYFEVAKSPELYQLKSLKKKAVEFTEKKVSNGSFFTYVTRDGVIVNEPELKLNKSV